MRALQRTLVIVIITLLNDSERSLNNKWLRPVTNKANPPPPPQLIENESETPSYLQCKLFHFIYPHKVILKIESENIACKVPYENPFLFCSHLGFSGDTPIDLNRKRLKAPWRALAFREKAPDSTPSARFVEHASQLFMKKEADHMFLCTGFAWSANSQGTPKWYADRVDGMTRSVIFTSATLSPLFENNYICPKNVCLLFNLHLLHKILGLKWCIKIMLS